MELGRRLWEFLKQHRGWILIGLAIYVIAMLVLIFTTRGPQSEPFQYQIF